QSREYNGRWYTDVKAWRVTREEEGGAAAPPAAGEEPWPDPSTAGPDDGPGDDLPF
nr:DUF3127 domain-containing protein [Gemmatimonadota bacterium]NIQ54190.1 DUF3127 domain-containing protein [Gemmatimonadota bacterium]NIU74387.1 DUF3127 domain-containing protein [Gammaproteobacteria bacterium]NIX44378.1 DUF3127 domain-containing protein [Gemmatimonadota bacterium]NIY08597.1 DUF3127 domain-containing protein [Gemmatimonadota bacterium]